MRFKLVQLMATRGAVETLRQDEILLALALHSSCEWGELDAEDKQANEAALKCGARILSAYTFRKNRVWVITEAGRQATTILLPEEY